MQGPGCSKLMTSLVDETLNYKQNTKMESFFGKKMWVAFAIQKLLTIFQQKNITTFGSVNTLKPVWVTTSIKQATCI